MRSARAGIAMVVGAAVIELLTGCVVRPVDNPKPGDSQQTTRHLPQSTESAIDLLFVIDNSESMEHEQANLAANFPRLIEALRSEVIGPDGSGRPCSAADRRGCAIPDVHIGVVSSDLGVGPFTNVPGCGTREGDRGKLQHRPRRAGCTAPSDDFISYAKGTTNVAGDGDPIETVKDTFGCIAQLGVGGCGFEQQLEAARRALDPNANLNPGFVRDRALLAVVFITDEDDCSAENPQLFDPGQSRLSDPLGPLTSFRCFDFGVSCNVNDRTLPGVRKDCRPAGDYLWDVQQQYADFLRRLKPGGRVVVAAIAGPSDRIEVGRDSGSGNPSLQPSCQSSGGIAVPAVRIAALLEAMKPDSQQASICDEDFGPALDAIGRKLVGIDVHQCIGAPLLTRVGTVACQQGDNYGTPCEQSCLHDVSCEVADLVPRDPEQPTTQPIEKCPRELWYPTNWDDPGTRDCGEHCPCWRIVRKAPSACDPTLHGGPYALDILREREAEPGTVARVSCLTSPLSWGSKALGELAQCDGR